jgi:branched-chain amino acid transport system substrate-binding protein
MKTKYIAVIVLLVLGGAFFVSNYNKSNEAIRIGVMVPLTGPAAALGEWSREGILLAEKEINENGGINGRKIELVIEDDGCDGRKAVDAFKKLQSLQKIDYFVGPLCGAARIPVIKAAEGTDAVIMTTGLAYAFHPKFNVATFNVLPTVESLAEKIVEFGSGELKYKKYSHLYSEDEYGNANNTTVNSTVQKLGGTIISSEKHPRGTNDLRTQLLKFKNDGSEVLIASTYGPDYAVLLKQAKELGFNKPILGVSSLQTPEPAAINKTSGQKIHYAYPAASTYHSVVAFGDLYRKNKPQAGAFIPMYIGAGYDSLMVLSKGLDACRNLKVDCVSNHIQNLKHDGANGPISFSANGNNDNASSIEIRVLENGKFSGLK